MITRLFKGKANLPLYLGDKLPVGLDMTNTMRDKLPNHHACGCGMLIFTEGLRYCPRCRHFMFLIEPDRSPWTQGNGAIRKFMPVPYDILMSQTVNYEHWKAVWTRVY